MKNRLIIMILITSMFSTAYSQQKLEIDGSIKIGNSVDPNPASGTIRWTGLNLEVWNGFIWLPLTSFQITQIISDIDGNQYRTVSIGDQEWMAENLRTTKYRNGDTIPNVTNNTDWGNLGSGAYCWYNNDDSNEQPYGKLYNWYAVGDARGLCPAGWHVPSDIEWTTLTDFLGGQSGAGGPMKEAGTVHWFSPNTGATNESGFTGLPGGYRNSGGASLALGSYGYWWSETESSNTFARFRSLEYKTVNVDRSSFVKKFGISVRCVRE